ncbi:hypothetical protein AFCDBAGC_5082 [Methylobacterium cerastii]|uniref:Uncharacterized protein n=1 Tax=Methylobacterium cerastii TaxID=932741 RepID=A0ABQ4QR66_9HYPH|nr:hypothetical protein AFCDBAGC_5082 [Methylobacterium cerastii]
MRGDPSRAQTRPVTRAPIEEAESSLSDVGQSVANTDNDPNRA